MTVSVDMGSQLQTYSYDTSVGNTESNMMWASNTYTFVATSSTTTLTFTSTTPGAFGPALDNVSIKQLTFAVCHRDNGKKGQIIYVDSQDAINAHLRQHNDTVGLCSVPQ